MHRCKFMFETNLRKPVIKIILHVNNILPFVILKDMLKKHSNLIDSLFENLRPLKNYNF